MLIECFWWLFLATMSIYNNMKVKELLPMTNLSKSYKYRYSKILSPLLRIYWKNLYNIPELHSHYRWYKTMLQHTSKVLGPRTLIQGTSHEMMKGGRKSLRSKQKQNEPGYRICFFIFLGTSEHASFILSLSWWQKFPNKNLNFKFKV